MQERGFLYVHTPIITAADCEGAGEMFQVTTLLPEDLKKDVSYHRNAKQYVMERCDLQAVIYAIDILRYATQHLILQVPRLKDGSIDYKKDFFGKPAMLTVSGQVRLCVVCFIMRLFVLLRL